MEIRLIFIDKIGTHAFVRNVNSEDWLYKERISFASKCGALKDLDPFESEADWAERHPSSDPILKQRSRDFKLLNYHRCFKNNIGYYFYQEL